MPSFRSSPIGVGMRSAFNTGPMRLLQRVLSTGSISAKDGPDKEVPSPPRIPLGPVVPPPLDSPASFGSEASDIEPPHAHFSKRQRLPSARFGSLLSPLARSAFGSSQAAPSGFRPPPIRTMNSLEGLDHWGGEVTAIPTPPAEDALMAALSVVPPPPTPTARPPTGGFRASGPNRNSRLGLPALSLVAPGIYVGDETAAATLARLRENGITHVLNCTNKLNPALEGADSGVGYLRLDLLDNSSDLPRMQGVLRAGVDFIRSAVQQGGVILIHCHRGISRSCTLAMAYLIETQQRPAESVFESIRAARRICDPNLSYWCALKEWENAVLPFHLQRPLSRSGSRTLATPSPSPRPLSRAG